MDTQLTRSLWMTFKLLQHEVFRKKKSSQIIPDKLDADVDLQSRIVSQPNVFPSHCSLTLCTVCS